MKTSYEVHRVGIGEHEEKKNCVVGHRDIKIKEERGGRWKGQ